MNTALPRPIRFGLLALALVALALLAWRQAERIADPWEAGIGGVNSGGYMGYMMRGYEHTGIMASGGIPVLLFHEHEPNLTVPYVNHPPLPFVLYALSYRHFGRSEAALRGATLAVLALLLLVLARALRSRAHPGLPALALMAFATMPVTAQYSRMVNIVPLVVFTMTLTLALWARHQRILETASSGVLMRSRLMVAAAALLNALTDWLGYGVAAIAVFDALVSRGPQRWRRLLDAVLLIGFAQVLGIVLHFAWLYCAPALGGVNLIERFSELFGENTQHPDVVLADWPPVMATWMLTSFGWPWLILSGLGILHLILRPRDISGTRLTWILLGAGLIPNLVFWRHAVVHEFWPMTLAPGMACAVARAGFLLLHLPARIAAGHRSLRLAASFAVLTAVALSAWISAADSLDLLDRYDTTRFRDRGLALNEHITSRDLILRPGDLTADRHYVVAPMIPLMNGPAEIAELQDAYRGRIDGVERIFIFWPRDWMEQGDWLKTIPRESWLPIHWADSDGILLEMRRDDWD